jgi:predicted metal-dependent phosphoesterase TrpH
MSQIETFERLPLPLTSLPQALQRFCDPSGPSAARMMAAKGLVPVRGSDQITLLAQLAHDATAEVKTAADRSLRALPEAVLLPACEAMLPAAVLDLLAELFENNQEMLARLIANNATHNSTIETIARSAGELLAERIATNETRLLGAPRIIEALYKNRNTRMSTADRLVELAARNGLDLPGIPAFKEHVEALQGQLIAEPTDEPLPQDEVFSRTVAADSGGDDPVFEEDATGTEQVAQKYKPLSMLIAELSKSEKIRMAAVGTKAARLLLVRDVNKQVAFAAISSPQTTAPEAAEIAKSKEVGEEILRYIGNKKDWIKSGEVKHNLVFNPKTPVGISMRYLGHMRADELRTLARSRNVSAQIRSLAANWAQRKEKG